MKRKRRKLPTVESMTVAMYERHVTHDDALRVADDHAHLNERERVGGVGIHRPDPSSDLVHVSFYVRAQP